MNVLCYEAPESFYYQATECFYLAPSRDGMFRATWRHSFGLVALSEYYIPVTGFAAESGKIRNNRTFSNLWGLNLFSGSILGWFHDQDVVGSYKKVAEKIACTKITRYYLRRHLYRVISSRHHLCPNPPQTFERKLSLFWWKEPIIKIQKFFCFDNFHWTWITFGSFENKYL